MPRLTRKQAKETIEAYLARHPNATSSEIGKALGVSKQRAHQLLTLVKGADTPLTDYELKILRYMAMGNTNKEIGEANSSSASATITMWTVPDGRAAQVV